ncbi:MAG: sensor histidine kinase [Halanaerobiales bacterium]
MNNTPFSLRKKLIIYFIIFFLLILIGSIYINIGYRHSNNLLHDILDQNHQLERMAQELQALEFYSENYLSEGEAEDLQNYRETTDNISSLQANISRLPESQKYIDFIQATETILQEAEKTITAKEREDRRYYNLHSRLSKDIQILSHHITTLINRNNSAGSQSYSRVNSHLVKIRNKTIILTILSGILSLIVVLFFTSRITHPLRKIMYNARKISRGNFDVNPIKVNTRDELKQIADIFNQMTTDIKNLFSELREKMKLERELQQEKMENLRTNNLLREAELSKLQAQVNPHFLYNTLNTISQVAILEDADRTGELIKKVARLLRYNLKQSDAFVPVKDEIENLKIYCHIMEVRYEDKITYDIKYDKTLDEYQIPCMVIQPLLENSFLHGLNELKDQQGYVEVQVKKENGYIVIRVRDNGRGMKKDQIEKIMNTTSDSVSGLANIKQRLELYFNRKNLLQIKSKPGQGTEVTVRVPLRKGGN